MSQSLVKLVNNNALSIKKQLLKTFELYELLSSQTVEGQSNSIKNQ